MKTRVLRGFLRGSLKGRMCARSQNPAGFGHHRSRIFSGLRAGFERSRLSCFTYGGVRPAMHRQRTFTAFCTQFSGSRQAGLRMTCCTWLGCACLSSGFVSMGWTQAEYRSKRPKTGVGLI